MERRLEILKDSHAGAFAIISCSVYFLAYTGIYSMLTAHAVKVIAISFILSRTLSGLSVICFPQARKKDRGLWQHFRKCGKKSESKNAHDILIVLSALMIVVGKWSGAAAVIYGTSCILVLSSHVYQQIRRGHWRSGRVFPTNV